MEAATDRKQLSRQRIVDAASRLFRRAGYRRTTVDELMAAAGLTRGGFYAHFSNKADLLSAGLELAFAQARENLLANGLEGLTGEEWLARARHRYLSPAHRDAPEGGCAIPALGAEVARDEAPARLTFEREVARMVDAMASRIGGPPRVARARAIRELATMVGGLLLARAVQDEELSREILESCATPER